MANDEPLNQRIRQILSRRERVSERKMFGGACFMIGGNMCVGTWKGSLIVRLERKNHHETLAEPHTKPADMNGRVMKGWALVEPARHRIRKRSDRLGRPSRQVCRIPSAQVKLPPGSI